MKKVLFLTILSLTTNMYSLSKNEVYENRYITTEESEPKPMSEFLKSIGFRESSNRYHIVNDFGCMGKYQFNMTTLEELGFQITEEEFLNNPQIQEKAMIKHLRYNRKILKDYIEKYNGTIIDGKKITESGILAAAHLGGAGSVKKYFNNGNDKRDKLGTKITDYLIEFSGYNLKI